METKNCVCVKLTFKIKINGKTVHKVVQKKPCLFKRVNVFAGMPSSTHKTAKGKLKNLYYETTGNNQTI